MAPSKLRKAIGAVKDRTSISLAKVGGSNCLSDLEVAIVKATRHEEYPPEERHIREILSLTAYSRANICACVDNISRRLGKTKNWVVALKSVMLIHRLLSDGDPSYEQEIFFATRRGTRLLNMSEFRDSKSNSWDYSALVRTYSLYLDEQLEYRMQSRRGKRSAYAYDEDLEEIGPNAIMVKPTPLREMKNEDIFSRIQYLMQLLERFLACRPAGLAKTNRIVFVALYPLVKESFQLYYEITEIITILIDKFHELSIPDSVKVHEIFCRINKQYHELEQFYIWCKTVGIGRSSEYPDIENIPQKKLDLIDAFIREKPILEQNGNAMRYEPKREQVEKAQEPEPELEPQQEQDMNAIKALPPPEGIPEETNQEEKTEVVKTQEVGNLLNLSEDAPTMEEHGNQLALALFDGGPETAAPSTTSPWEAFKDSGDWETALVQHTSHLSNQKASLAGGFDTLMLDGMYQQGAVAQVVASSGVVATGSASSVALGSAGRPAMLALPAPPSAGSGPNTAGTSTDPFAASLAIAPPPYVQMSEMEKKQRLLVEEQVMWQQYQRDGMHGQIGLATAQPNPCAYNMGGYTKTF
uniref:Clathrin assembly protein At1g03050 n=1 Tax=Nicotiana tabacum TaxID=4097 RepID=A0A1S4BT16_TOBAC|nr:PREDICTED: putative clathrin assembly protein At1g03050 [Nicotiana tabacum]XP_016492025.1 PREDICTED: putative clathrin assembly protein At1g03050 [Nicotiana tabacum]